MKIRMIPAVLISLLACNAGAESVLGDARLPADLPSAGPAAAVTASKPWTINDIVEICRIEGVAMAETSRRVAFMVKQGSVDSGELRYAIYVIDNAPGAVARKLVEAPFMGDLSWHPGTDRWTVRADFGDAVQLYDVDDSGGLHPLVINHDTATVGSQDGVLRTANDEARQTGVLSYEWAPDGSALWYVRMRLQTPVERVASSERGIVYDDSVMSFFDMRHPDHPYLGKEMRLLDPLSNNDRLLAYAPASGIDDMGAFYPHPGFTEWLQDSRHVKYMLRTAKRTGEREFATTVVDIKTGEEKVQPQSIYDINSSMPIGAKGHYLSVKQGDSGQTLIEYTADGKVYKDYGKVDYRRFGEGARFRDDAPASPLIAAVHYRDHDGLITFPASSLGDKLAKVEDSLSQCVFSKDLKQGVCVRESLIKAPELVAVSGSSGDIRVLARPNARYDEIEPLHSERVLWTNKYGNVSDGYITYPRNYIPGKKYPTIVVTHGGDAQNLFAAIGLQAECPLQVLAERGYLVLSVNDPWITSRTRAAHEAFNTGHNNVPAEAQQFEEAYNAIASMDAALQSMIDKGIADPERTGIWGFSRGGAVVEWTMSQSKMFKAAAGGDCAGWDAGVYWMFGFDYRSLYKGIYGGSPYDPKALANYRKLSPSMRASEFAGPLLEQCTPVGATIALEIHTMLQDAGIPSEVAFFPNESHVFWHPRHRAFAMEKNLDWFNYWLLGVRDDKSTKVDQYGRWDKMASTWNASRALTSNK